MVSTVGTIVLSISCYVSDVDILPDIDDLHVYNVTLECIDGSKIVRITTDDPPPEIGDAMRPSDTSVIILMFITSTFFIFTIFSVLILIMSFVYGGSKSIVDGTLKHQLLA